MDRTEIPVSEALEAWAFNVMLECMGNEADNIEVLMGGAILDLRDLDRILTWALNQPEQSDGQG